MTTESSSRSSVPNTDHIINDDSHTSNNSNRSNASRASLRKINFEELTCPCGRLRMHTSTTNDNPRRCFIRCPLWRHIKPHKHGGMGDVVEAVVEAKLVEDEEQIKKIMRLRTKLVAKRKKSHFLLEKTRNMELLRCSSLSIGTKYGNGASEPHQQHGNDFLELSTARMVIEGNEKL
ncbi:hypothetical protein RIF29_29737 [Crotalaria pallida]|uniref:Uncharacterized protein n=1 Tax=Crotalaria pallida TaxID=3830 RepID=A0AAN9EFF0_CROPI